MTRKEYLSALEKALASAPEELRTAALDFYGEMIDDRMEDGLDEASAVAAMEKPEEIAARLRAEASGEGTEKAPEAGGPASSMQDDALEFSSLADQVLQAASQVMDHVPDLMNAGVEKAETARKKAEAAGSQAEKKIDRVLRELAEKETDLGQKIDRTVREMEDKEPHIEEEESDAKYAWKTFTCPVSQVRSIRLYAVDMPISVTPCAGDTVTLRYYTSIENPYTLTLTNGELCLHHPERSVFRVGFSLEKLGGLLRVAWSSPTHTIHLEMPADAFVDLMAHTTNGSIKAGGFSALCAVELKTSNSRIELTDSVCKTLDMESSNGRLVLRRVESKQRLRGKTSNSRIEAEQVRAGEGVTLHTSNGRVQVSDVTAKGEMDIKTSNGSISVENVQAARVILKSSNGGISGVLPGRQADWAIDSGTSNGHNSLPKSQPGHRPLSVHTSNGSISLRFQET